MATTQLPTTLDPLPPLPSASVPLTDQAWRDYHTRLNQWLGKLATYATTEAGAVNQLLTGAAAAATAWQAASAGSSTTSSGS